MNVCGSFSYYSFLPLVGFTDISSRTVNVVKSWICAEFNKYEKQKFCSEALLCCLSSKPGSKMDFDIQWGQEQGHLGLVLVLHVFGQGPCRAEDKEKLDLSFLSSHKENKDLDLYCKNKTKDVDDLSLSSLSSDKEKAETKGDSGFCCKDKTKDLDNLDLSSLSPDKKDSSFVLLVSR